MKMWTVYKHTTPNNKVYIGITSNKPVKRWNAGRGYIGNTLFYRAIEKYGWKNIKHEILFSNMTKEEAAAKEIELIAFYRSNEVEFGYNLSSGGEYPRAGLVLSDEYKRKLSEANKGKRPTEETREKLKIARQGRKPALGMKHTEETKQKISAIHSKKVKCIETGFVYPSVVVAASKTGIERSNIGRVCRKGSKTAGGYHWEYVTSEVVA